MLWEYLFNIPTYPGTPILILLLDFAPIIACLGLFIVLLVLGIKFRKWQDVIDADGKLLGIIIDNAGRATFKPIRSKLDVMKLKDYGVRQLDPEATYTELKKRCKLAIWYTPISVALPVKFTKFIDPDTEEPEYYTTEDGKPILDSEGKPIPKIKAKQIDVKEWYRWLAHKLSPYSYDAELDFLARAYGNLREMPGGETKGKIGTILVFAILGIGIAAALMFFLR